MIVLDDVSYSYDGRTPALDGVSLRIPDGEFLCILGGNGSGKSTLAKHLNALLVPDAGTVLVDGIDTSDPEYVYDVRARVGYVFQNPDDQLVATLVADDVAFGPENLGLDPALIGERCEESLDEVGLTGFGRREAHALSGGQKQRVAIARALAMDPKVMLLDEPTSALDPELVGEVLSVIRDLADGGMTMIMATHQMDFARALATDILFMEQGKIIEQGAPDVLLAPGSGTRTSDFCGKLFDLRGTEKSDEPTVSELLTGDLSHDITDDGSESSMIPDAPKKD